MNISIVIPVASLVAESIKYRIEVLQHALCYFYKNVEVILVEQSLDGKMYVHPYFNTGKHENLKLIELRYKKFNKPWCINVGVAAAKYDNIVICDCDMFSKDHTIWIRLMHYVEINKYKWCFAWNRLVYTDREKRSRVLAGERLHPGEKYTIPTPAYSEGGMVYVEKQFFYDVGQCCEYYQDLGGPDTDIICRLKHVTKNYPMFPFIIYHMWHPQIPKKSRPTRRENVSILRKTQKHPSGVIEWLKRQKQGIKESPLIARKKFLS